jgi:hypothetical protein
LLSTDPPDQEALPPGPLFADFQIANPEPQIPEPIQKEENSPEDSDVDVFSIWFG